MINTNVKIMINTNLELSKGVKRLQSNSDFINKIKERSNTAIFKPSATIKLGTYLLTIVADITMKTKSFR